MRLWKPVLIADSRLGSKEQHQYTTGTSAFSNYSVESRSAPQYYNCNFCEREFRSAQALGGHMNVHRRDRALLRFSSNSTSSTFLPPDDIPLISRKPDYSLHDTGLGCLPQKPHLPLPTSPDNNRSRSCTPSPFFHFFDNSSPKLGSDCQSPYSKEADICWFRSNVVYGNRFELNKEEPPSPSNPLSVIRSGGIVDLRRKMRWEAAAIQDVPSNGGLDLELRLGNTS